MSFSVVCQTRNLCFARSGPFSHILSHLNVQKGQEFKPLRSIGPHLPSCIEVSSPAELFKLYFDSDRVQKICDATNEYAERNKDEHPVINQRSGGSSCGVYVIHTMGTLRPFPYTVERMGR